MIDTLIKGYEDKIEIIYTITDDLDRNIKLAKKEEKPNFDVLEDMKSTRRSFYSKAVCYSEFIERLKELKGIN